VRHTLPAEGFGPQLDRAILLDDTQQLQPPLQSGRAAGAVVVFSRPPAIAGVGACPPRQTALGSTPCPLYGHATGKRRRFKRSNRLYMIMSSHEGGWVNRNPAADAHFAITA
jgi:hypothetical protein